MGRKPWLRRKRFAKRDLVPGKGVASASMEETDVLVVGAGPTGLTMACELARHGVKPQIIDKATAPSDKSKAFAVHARTLELFENMGMVEQILAKGQPAGGVAFYDEGEKLVSIDIAGAISSKYPFIQIIAQSDTEEVLLEHLDQYELKVQRGVELLGFSGDGEHVVARLRDEGGSERELRCRYLIGNDGAHSRVRKELGLPFEGAPYPSQWLLADIELDWDLPYDELSVFFHRSGTTAFFPLYGRRGRLMFESPDAPLDEVQPEPTTELVRQKCEERKIPYRAIENPTWLAWFRLHHRIVSSYQVGSVFLGGDAAHIHSPVGGQGMNMGIQDAYNLAWKLALVLHGKAVPSLLDSYQVERHRIDSEIVEFTDVATKAATIHNPVFSAIRNTAIRIVSKFSAIQARMLSTMAQVELHYRDSPIVAEDWSRPTVSGFTPAKHELAAGERVPDFELLSVDDGRTECLYDLLTGSEHELIMFCGVAPTDAELSVLHTAVSELGPEFGDLLELHLVRGPGEIDDLPPVASTHVDPGLRMHAAFGAASTSFVLVRPDGYVAYRNQPADLGKLRTYMRSVFGG
jgi:2-polyprenyl-6-methoxyphenol hydroxylase-like FAD-dependent oxidoreductase